MFHHVSFPNPARYMTHILDEATASIDSATDAEISRVIHKEFTNSTVIIIKHNQLLLSR
jgi:ABC-type transport system involved in cytochrome bd biosynthesis fused ATPase/permease subunit